MTTYRSLEIRNLQLAKRQLNHVAVSNRVTVSTLTGPGNQRLALKARLQPSVMHASDSAETSYLLPLRSQCAR